MVNAGVQLTGNTSHNNAGNGFSIGSGQLRDSVAHGNGLYGLEVRFASNVAIGGNAFLSNGAGTIDGTAVEVGVNQCGTNTTCP